MAKHEKRVPLGGSERQPRTGAREVGVPDPNERIRVSVLVRPRSPLEELASRKEMGSTRPANASTLPGRSSLRATAPTLLTWPKSKRLPTSTT